ncbi:MAG TPA: hypothetical protein VEC16_04400 [Alphaproteobacteria bacterium]|nr:hypothetical protein [Alphaproteobacteria bacterium]
MNKLLYAGLLSSCILSYSCRHIEYEPRRYGNLLSKVYDKADTADFGTDPGRFQGYETVFLTPIKKGHNWKKKLDKKMRSFQDLYKNLSPEDSIKKRRHLEDSIRSTFSLEDSLNFVAISYIDKELRDSAEINEYYNLEIHTIWKVKYASKKSKEIKNQSLAAVAMASITKSDYPKDTIYLSKTPLMKLKSTVLDEVYFYKNKKLKNGVTHHHSNPVRKSDAVSNE